MYRITFSMTSPICYFELPVFDAILSYCEYAGRRKASDYHTAQGKEVDDVEIPLVKHDLGFYHASYMFTDNVVGGSDSWKKRWASRYDQVADFGKAKRRVDTGSGKFKSYSIPLVTQSCKEAWFYFDGDVDAVADMIDRIYGFGKKVAIGFGWFSGFEIEAEPDDRYRWFRPLPQCPEIMAELLKLGGIRIEPGYGAYKIPRWLPEHQGQIVTPYTMKPRG